MASVTTPLTDVQSETYWAGFRAGLSYGRTLPAAADVPTGGWGAGPDVSEAEARWAAETCPLDGGWVEGEPCPTEWEPGAGAAPAGPPAGDPAGDDRAAAPRRPDRADRGLPFVGPDASDDLIEEIGAALAAVFYAGDADPLGYAWDDDQLSPFPRAA